MKKTITRKTKGSVRRCGRKFVQLDYGLEREEPSYVQKNDSRASKVIVW